MIISVLYMQNVVPVHNQVPCHVGVWWSGDITLSILYLVPTERGVPRMVRCTVWLLFHYGKRAWVIPTAGMDMLVKGKNSCTISLSLSLSRSLAFSLPPSLPPSLLPSLVIVVVYVYYYMLLFFHSVF